MYCFKKFQPFSHAGKAESKDYTENKEFFPEAEFMIV
jgi:hypothetical protein